MKGIKIKENDQCAGSLYDSKCHLSTRWFVKTVDGLYRCPECKTLYRKLQDNTYKMVVNESEMSNYLIHRGWTIKDGSAYQTEDIEFKIPYNIEGTYSLYVRGIYKD